MQMNFYWIIQVKYFSPGEKSAQHNVAAQHRPPGEGTVHRGTEARYRGTVMKSTVPNQSELHCSVETRLTPHSREITNN